MKIVTRAELLTLPLGTLFAEATAPGQYGPLSIFSGPCGPDFFLRDITRPDATSGPTLDEREDAMWNEGASFPVNSTLEREGLFDDDIRYLVYEPADIAIIVALQDGSTP